MRKRLVVSPRADRELTEHACYIADENPEAARRLLTAARATFEQVALLPEMGSPRDYGKRELAGVRMVMIPAFPRHLVFYRATAGAIEIIRILHSSRDIKAVFEDE